MKLQFCPEEVQLEFVVVGQSSASLQQDYLDQVAFGSVLASDEVFEVVPGQRGKT